MLSLEDRYEQLKKDYESYQKMAEETMQKQSMKIVELDKKLDRMSLIVEISKYINRCLGISEIESMINDIMIGILGVTYSSVYLIENKKLKLKSSNLKNTEHHSSIDKYNNTREFKLKTYLLNSSSNISKDIDVQICSSIFMPIYLKDNLLGVIIVEHNRNGYLREEHMKLLTALSNQIAICTENNKLYNTIKENAQKDGLTGLLNRRYFFSIMENKMRCKEKNFSIVMIDIDNFKQCNDCYGHQYGDEVLKRVSNIIVNNIKKEDIAARYGGEEIIVYVSNVKNIIDVYKRMEFIRQTIENDVKGCNIRAYITVSMGIGMVYDEDDDLDEIIKRADVNLYKAKNSGKNKVIC